MKKIKIIFFTAFFFIVSSSFAQFVGIWQGTVSKNNSELLFVLRISEENGRLHTLLDVPQQMLLDFKSSKTSVIHDSLRVSFAALAANYKAERNGDSLIGIWEQSGESIVLNLTLTSEDKAFKTSRTQTPMTPFPYFEKDVTFVNKKAKIKLAGTLSLPDTIGSFPLAILVSGSGAQNRDEEIAKHKPFAIIADYFARNGIAVLRYDDRGAGKSEGNFAAGTTFDFAQDAEAAIAFAFKQSQINKKKIGIIGHSEGGIIALMLAAKNKSLNYIVSMAGVAIPCDQLLVMQNDLMLEGYNTPENVREFFWNFNTAFYNLIQTEKDPEKLKSDAISLISDFSAELSEKQKSDYNINDKFAYRMILAFSSPWMKTFLSINPLEYIKKIKINVLSLNGGKDRQVPAEPNLDAFRNYFSNYKDKKMQTKMFENLNHLFQPCQTGMPSEYAFIETTIDNKVLEYMCEWIKSL